jgi:hypothetical protein
MGKQSWTCLAVINCFAVTFHADNQITGDKINARISHCHCFPT